jgi:hypothetical protein
MTAETPKKKTAAEIAEILKEASIGIPEPMKEGDVLTDEDLRKALETIYSKPFTSKE